LHESGHKTVFSRKWLSLILIQRPRKAFTFLRNPFETKRKRGLSCYCYVTENKSTKKAFIGAHFTDMLDGRYVVSGTSKGSVTAVRFRAYAGQRAEVEKIIFSQVL